MNPLVLFNVCGFKCVWKIHGNLVGPFASPVKPITWHGQLPESPTMWIWRMQKWLFGLVSIHYRVHWMSEYREYVLWCIVEYPESRVYREWDSVQVRSSQRPEKSVWPAFSTVFTECCAAVRPIVSSNSSRIPYLMSTVSQSRAGDSDRRCINNRILRWSGDIISRVPTGLGLPICQNQQSQQWQSSYWSRSIQDVF